MNPASPSPIAQALLAQAASLEAQAETLKQLAALANTNAPPDSSEILLTEAEVKERYGMGRAALDARAVPRVRAGRAYRWRASDIEAALAAGVEKPRPPRKALQEGADLIDSLIESGELRRSAR